jgi:hypothetical protein
MSSEELRPCPFCDVHLKAYSEAAGYWHPKGDCPLADFEMPADGYSEARWNTRPSPTPASTNEQQEERHRNLETYAAAAIQDREAAYAKIEAMQAQITKLEATQLGMHVVIEQQRQEIERLREAMSNLIANVDREIDTDLCDEPFNHAMHTAQAALEEKPC